MQCKEVVLTTCSFLGDAVLNMTKETLTRERIGRLQRFRVPDLRDPKETRMIGHCQTDRNDRWLNEVRFSHPKLTHEQSPNATWLASHAYGEAVGDDGNVICLRGSRAAHGAAAQVAFTHRLNPRGHKSSMSILRIWRYLDYLLLLLLHLHIICITKTHNRNPRAKGNHIPA
jgi:hypothetical protein